MKKKVLHRKNYLPFIHFIVLAATLSTVFVTSGSLPHGVITAKCFWFAIVMCSVFIIFPLRIIGKYEIRITDILFSVFVIYVCINWFFLRGYPDMQWWLFLLMIPLYVAIRKAFVDECLRRWLIHIVLVVVLIETL